MKRRMFAFLLVLVMTVVIALPAAAQNSQLLDEAELLSTSETRDIQKQLDALSEEFEVDAVIVTMENTGRYDPEDYIEVLYDDGGYAQDGVMLLVAMEEREYFILSNGWCSDAISPSDIDIIVDAMQADMADGEYADAFRVFLDECDYYLDGHLNGFPFPFGASLLVAFIIGLVVALIATGIMRGKLKSVRKQHTANQYTRPGSMQITKSTDLYLYSNVTRVRKAQTSTSSGSRSGGGRSVGGGSF